jgi:hypothetical protein
MAARKGKEMVKYIGTSDVRSISSDDWKRLGIEQDDVTWSASNDFMVPAASLHESALALLSEGTDEWQVVSEDAASESHVQLELSDES